MSRSSRRLPRPPSPLAGADSYLLLSMLVAMIAIFGRLNGAWLTTATMVTAIEQNAPLAVVSVAMTFSIIAGIIDLSPGAMIALTGVIIGLVNQQSHDMALAVATGLGLAIGVSALHGVLVVGLEINPVIVTLAAYIWARGLATGITGTGSITVGGPLITFLNGASLFGLGAPAYIVALAYGGGWYLLNRTVLGRYTFALGGDARGARRAGIRVTRQVIFIFCLMGVAVAAAALISVGQMASAQPLAASGLELDAIIAVIIGGTRLTGGEGSVIKTLVGVAFIAILNSGLSEQGLSDAYYALCKGIAILLALSVQTLARRAADRQATRGRSLLPEWATERIARVE
ncbi:MAG TPA: ABC transporter permease [Chloroflexota bacterium]|nr:ABC transporter permease [Chloroflexota bacterium]